MNITQRLGTPIKLVASLAVLTVYSIPLLLFFRESHCTRGFLVWDFGYAIILASTIFVTQSFLLVRLKLVSGWVLILPLIYLVFDLTENTLAMTGPQIECNGGVVTLIKFIFVALSIFTVMVLLAINIVRKFRNAS